MLDFVDLKILAHYFEMDLALFQSFYVSFI